MSRPRWKTCAEPDCPELTLSTYCTTHERGRRAAKDQVRGTWRERGYDAEYDRNRHRVLSEESECWICLELVDKTLPGTHRNGPSVDHVIARDDGGTNERSNLRLAHLRCNTARGKHSTTPGVPPLGLRR